MSSRSFISSYGSTSATTCTPASSSGGRPRPKSSSSTHWWNGSQTTGHRSSTPNWLARLARSSSVVTGVMRSTMQLGNRTCSSTHSPSFGSRNRANAVKLRRAASPLPWMLSQDRTVKGARPRCRRRANASMTRPKRGLRRRAGLEVVYDARVVRVELPGDGVEVVAALGDGERDDPGLLVGHLLDHRLRVVRGEQVLDDRTHHAGDLGAVRALLHECVEAVLRSQGVLHPPVARQHPDPADPPVQGLALVHQAVEVQGLVGAVERTDTQVHDPRPDRAPVVLGHGHGRVERRQRRRVERRHYLIAPIDRPCTSLSWAANPADDHRERHHDGRRAHLGQEQALAGDEAGEEHRGGLRDRRR